MKKLLLILLMAGCVYGADSKITDLDTATTVAPTDLAVVVIDPGGSAITKKITIDDLTESIPAQTITAAMLLSTNAAVNGYRANYDSGSGGVTWTDPAETDPMSVKYHGIQAAGTLTFNNTDKYLTLPSITYWYKGTQYTSAVSRTCDLDLTGDRDNSSNTITANKLYYFYFKDATGKLYWSDSVWSFTENVFVATVYWTGTAGAVQRELHTHTRNIDWHIWGHDTIGTRYESGSELTTPTTATDNAVDIATGTYHDEDQDYATGRLQTIRGWRKVSTSVYTFEDYALPYLGANADPKFVDVDSGAGYVLTSVGDTDFVCYWVYASLDIDRPLYIIPTTANTAHNTLALARTETSPQTLNIGLNSEMKLIYKFIYRGDGEFQELVDYRSSSPVPGGGTSSVSAGSVSVNPTGNISSTNAQSALAELDSEKQVVMGGDDNYVTDAEKIVIGNTSGTNSGDNATNSQYSSLVSNATHTGDVTGSVALTIAAGRIYSSMLATTNSPADGQVPTYDEATTKVTWDTPAAGSASISDTLGETIAAGQPVYQKISDGKWYKAKAVDGYTNNLAVCTVGGNANDTGTFIRSGQITDLTGLPSSTGVWLDQSTAGAYVGAVPNSGVIVPIGSSESTTVLNVSIGLVGYGVSTVFQREIVFALEGNTAVETAFGSLYMHDGTNYNQYSRAFDDTTQEYAGGKFKVPENINPLGTVTFWAAVTAATGAASKNVQLSFEHKALTTNEAWDAAMTAEDSGDKAIDATTGDITIITWTETVANLGWVAGDYVPFRLSRKDAGSNDLTGDMYWFLFAMVLPLI